MKTNTYLDNIETRNMVKVEKNGYVAYSYEDYFMGEWYGNVNIVDAKTGKMVHHATTTKALTEKELEEFIDNIPKRIKILEDYLKGKK